MKNGKEKKKNGMKCHKLIQKGNNYLSIGVPHRHPAADGFAVAADVAPLLRSICEHQSNQSVHVALVFDFHAIVLEMPTLPSM